MKRALFVGSIVFFLSCSAVWADLASEFGGFTYVDEVGVSGLQSSNGATKLPTSMFTLGGDRVSYPSGVGTVPSPGGTTGKNFDQGILGVKTEGGNLVVKLAGGLNPETGYWSSDWSSRYGQGDVFLTVDDGAAGVQNFALLSGWGDNVHLGKSSETYYNQAQAFHADYEGFLVELTSAGDVVLTSGAGTYPPASSSPAGLDYRIFAQDGTGIGSANLQSGSVVDGQTWYIQTWTIPLSWLTTDSVFTLGLHAATSCSNDQIGMVTDIVTPVPAAAILGMLGLSVAGWRLRKRS